MSTNIKITSQLWDIALWKIANVQKIIAISSRRGSNSVNIEDNYKGRYAYRSSKAALNSAMVALVQDLKQNNITLSNFASRKGYYQDDKF